MYGGTTDKNAYQGMYVGANVVEGDKNDVTRAEVRSRLGGLDEHHCEVTCDGETTTGILQPLEPDAYNACARGRPGWRFLERARRRPAQLKICSPACRGSLRRTWKARGLSAGIFG